MRTRKYVDAKVREFKPTEPGLEPSLRPDGIRLGRPYIVGGSLFGSAMVGFLKLALGMIQWAT